MLPGGRFRRTCFRYWACRLRKDATFLPEEDRLGAEPVIILGHSFWQRRFGGNPAAIGKPVILDGKSFTVVGIAPANFRLDGEEPDEFTPLGQDNSPSLQRRDRHPGISAVGKAATRRDAKGGTRGTGIDCASPSRAIPGRECRPQLRSGPAASRGGRCRADVVVAAGRGEPGAVDRVRECGEPAAGARDFAGTRTRNARGLGSGADPVGAPRPDRERGAGRPWRNARSFNRRAWCPAVCGVLAGEPSEGRGNSA